MENLLSDHQTVGTLLREERERQGKSLEDVSGATHIRKVFLEYIEEDHFDDLPSKLHITGFLNVYSHYLGLSEQLVMGRYKKQMFLLQEIPAEEIFSISQDSLGKRGKSIKSWLLFSSIGIVVLLLILLFYGYSHSSKKWGENSRNHTLSSDHALDIQVNEGGTFSFFYKNKENRYRLLDMTNQSVTLMDTKRQITFPPFLYTEGLEYDMDNNQEYDYMIYAQEKEQNGLKLHIVVLNKVRNPGQDSFAIVQLSHVNDITAKDFSGAQKGVLSFQNTSDHDLFLMTENMKGDWVFVKLLPQQETGISYFDERQRPLYKTLFLQDTHAFQIKMDGQDLNLGGDSGAVGVLSCAYSKQKEESSPKCNFTEGV